MENALLVGLSRQIALRRELDVVANNIANINTTGFKADGALFEEYLMPVARADRFSDAGPPLSASCRTARTWHDIQPGRRRSRPAIRSTSPSTATASSSCRRRAASATPATARCRSTPQGQLVTSDGHRGARRQRPDHSSSRPTRDIAISRDGTITVREGANADRLARGKLRLVELRRRRSSCRRTAPALSRRRPASQPQPAANARVIQGSIEKSNVNGVVEMTRMIEVTRTYTQVATMLQQQDDMRRTAIEKLAEVPA